MVLMAGMARSMGATLSKRKNCLAKIKLCDSQFLQSLFCSPYKQPNCTAASTQSLTISIVIIRTCYVQNEALWQNCSMVAQLWYCRKTVVLAHDTMVRHCQRTRTLAFRIYKISSSQYTKDLISRACCSVSDKKILARMWSGPSPAGGQVVPGRPIWNRWPPISRLAHRLLHTSNTVF